MGYHRANSDTSRYEKCDFSREYFLIQDSVKVGNMLRTDVHKLSTKRVTIPWHKYDCVQAPHMATGRRSRGNTLQIRPTGMRTALCVCVVRVRACMCADVHVRGTCTSASVHVSFACGSLTLTSVITALSSRSVSNCRITITRKPDRTHLPDREYECL